MIIGLSRSVSLAKEISRLTGEKFVQLNSKRFPDGELYLRFPKQISRKVVLVQSMHPAPDNAIIEAIFAGKTAREIGAKKVTLAAPYLAYLRQDKRFKKGECVSNRIMAGLLDFFDEIITIDPHLHRISSLQEIFSNKARHITANQLIADFISKNHPDSILIGPDIESGQWAAEIAKKINHPFTILKKKRYSAETVRVKVHAPEVVKGRTVILVDDIISTGHTMLEPIKQLKKLGAKKIICICVHGIFAENALEKLKHAGAEVIATNTIANHAAKISVAGIIAEHINNGSFVCSAK
ncbi:MAG: ribose-phosphate diphosphokinase [Candidatus Aenigmarchaeota archaeon]|nr:ribose-phosphate diphosphokinase [Candidatus Aenigmarchaeota archaeon]